MKIPAMMDKRLGKSTLAENIAIINIMKDAMIKNIIQLRLLSIVKLSLSIHITRF